MALNASKNDIQFCRSPLNMGGGMEGSFIVSRIIGCDGAVETLDGAFVWRSIKSKVSALREQKKSLVMALWSSMSAVLDSWSSISSWKHSYLDIYCIKLSSLVCSWLNDLVVGSFLSMNALIESIDLLTESLFLISFINSAGGWTSLVTMLIEEWGFTIIWYTIP